MPTLLIVDDEPNVRYSLEKTLKSESLQIVTAGTAGEAIECVQTTPPDVIILDIRLPDMSGLEAYGQIRAIDARIPVILVTAHAATETAIEAMKLGAFEYLLKPLDLHQLRDVVHRAVELSRMSRVPAMLDEAEPSHASEADRLIGRSPLMQELYKSIGRVAPQDVTVLILGESGTGKELIARAVYQHSRRSQAPFLAINCAAIPETLLESELFGHERGAFTGADRRRIGKFEQASGGTIFLDEVGDMSLATQAKVLRLLQDQQFERVGGEGTIRTDVRVIAATNQNLEAHVADGRFRQDLFYRLNVFTIHVPPLRERIEDLALMVQHFLARMSAELGKHVRDITPDAMELLWHHTWPGNVRELQSTVKFALVHAMGEVLTADCLPPNLRCPEASADAAPSSTAGPTLEVTSYVRKLLADRQGDIYYRVQSAVDRIVLDEVLRYVRGNQVDAAHVLGVSRNTLRSKLRLLGLALEKQLTSEADHAAQ